MRTFDSNSSRNSHASMLSDIDAAGDPTPISPIPMSISTARTRGSALGSNAGAEEEVRAANTLAETPMSRTWSRESSLSRPGSPKIKLPDDFVNRLGDICIFECTDQDICGSRRSETKAEAEQMIKEWNDLKFKLKKTKGAEPKTFHDMHARMLALEALIQNLKAYSLIYAIEKQISKFNVDPDTYLERRKEIVHFISNHLHLRKAGPPIDTLSLKCGWRNYLRAKKPRQEMNLYKCFGQPHLYLQVGPDVSIMVSAQNKDSASDPYSPLVKGRLVHDTAYAQRGRRTECIIGNSQFGDIVRVSHNKIDICVKLLDKDLMRKKQKLVLDNAPSEVQNHRALCQIDHNSPRAVYPSPHIVQFIKVMKDSKLDVWYYAMELGRDAVAVNASNKFSFNNYDRKLKQWYKSKKKEIRGDPTWSRRLENISPYEVKMRHQILQAAFGIFFMHMRGVTHNDIKISNLVVGNFDQRAKIIDFGQSTRFTSDERAEMLCDHKSAGAPRCRSPEANFVKENRCELNIPQRAHFCATKNDVWCIGITMYRTYLMLEPYMVQDNIDPWFPYLTGGSYMTDKSLKNLQRITNDVKNKKRKTNYTHTNANGELDFQDGIFRIIEKFERDADGVRRKNRKFMITEDAVRLMHRIFVPEKQRISICEFILDPYFNGPREEIIKDIESWQKTRFGKCDNILSSLNAQLEEERMRQRNRKQIDRRKQKKRPSPNSKKKTQSKPQSSRPPQDKPPPKGGSSHPPLEQSMNA